MTSLKSQIPNLAGWLRMTPAALYERQRALVRAGLLKAKPGRGRGTEVALNPHSLATLLISVVASDSLTETPELTKIFVNLKSEGEQCPITGKKTFGAALTQILNSELVPRLAWIDASVSWDNYSAAMGLRKEEGHYYTEDDFKRLNATGEKPDRDKMKSSNIQSVCFASYRAW